MGNNEIFDKIMIDLVNSKILSSKPTNYSELELSHYCKLWASKCKKFHIVSGLSLGDLKKMHLPYYERFTYYTTLYEDYLIGKDMIILTVESDTEEEGIIKMASEIFQLLEDRVCKMNKYDDDDFKNRLNLTIEKKYNEDHGENAMENTPEIKKLIEDRIKIASKINY